MSQENSADASVDSRGELKRKIVSEYPRLGPNDSFKFACHPDLTCFNHCCGDVNIFLSPYDVLRLKNRLGLTSKEFLDTYALMPVQKEMKTPVIVLKMNDDEKKTCPFLTEKGCGQYADRPWPCRMYPLGLASPPEGSEEDEFFFLLKEDICKGHDSDRKWTVNEWMQDQDVAAYHEMGELYKQVTLHPRIQQGKALEPKQIDMLFTACYDMDKFRRFLFETTFFEKFDVSAEMIEKLKTDDVELLRFGFRWIGFFILKEKTLVIKDEVVKARQEELS